MKTVTKSRYFSLLVGSRSVAYFLLLFALTTFSTPIIKSPEDTVVAPIKVMTPFRNTIEIRYEVTQGVKPILTNLIVPSIEYQTFSFPSFALRVDVPFGWASSNQQTTFGLSDIYFQPSISIYANDNFQFPIGTAWLFPSATSKSLGSGKWQFSPMLYPRYILSKRKNIVALKIRNFFSFAGDQSRANINLLDITPEVKVNLTEKIWMYSEIARVQINWNQGGAFNARSNLQLGSLFTKRIGAWAIYSIYWGEERPIQYQIRTSVFFKY